MKFAQVTVVGWKVLDSFVREAFEVLLEMALSWPGSVSPTDYRGCLLNNHDTGCWKCLEVRPDMEILANVPKIFINVLPMRVSSQG